MTLGNFDFSLQLSVERRQVEDAGNERIHSGALHAVGVRSTGPWEIMLHLITLNAFQV